MKEFFKYLFNFYSIILYLVSITLLFFSGSFSQPLVESFLIKVMEVFGTGIMITTLVSSILNFYFQKEINRYFSIIRGAEKAGILKIYPNRAKALKDIIFEFKKSRGPIDLLSIAGTDFFHKGIINEIDKMCSHNSSNNIRVLLLDPRSKHAHDRAILEEGANYDNVKLKNFKYIESKLCKDILYSIGQIEKIFLDIKKKDKSGFTIDARCYDTAPILLMVRVNDRFFIEQYHYGISENEKQTSLTKCLGKKTPVIEFRASSTSSQLYLSHFNYLWDTSKKNKIWIESCESIRNEIYNKKDDINNADINNKKNETGNEDEHTEEKKRANWIIKILSFFRRK